MGSAAGCGVRGAGYGVMGLELARGTVENASGYRAELRAKVRYYRIKNSALTFASLVPTDGSSKPSEPQPNLEYCALTDKPCKSCRPAYLAPAWLHCKVGECAC